MTPFLLLAVLAPVADPQGHRPDTRAERTYYCLADLTPAEARLLEGKRSRFRVTLDSLADESTYSPDCQAPAELFPRVSLPAGQEDAHDITVEARLVVLDWPPGD
jgi:hypothetical protein